MPASGTVSLTPRFSGVDRAYEVGLGTQTVRRETVETVRATAGESITPR
jgi:hypothetical protein